MKTSLIKLIGAVIGAGVLSSCYYDPYYYPSYSTSPGYVDSGTAWVAGTYDSAGIPIYGYSYGRPVYGYTSAGAAIFATAALTALCLVPDWDYAPWYRGSWRYPSYVKRYHAPSRYPSGHRPHIRPKKVVRNTTVIKNNTYVRPTSRPNYNRPNYNRPNYNRPSNNNRPNYNRPNNNNRPNFNRPSNNNRPNFNRPSNNNRPNFNRPSNSSRPNYNRPSNNRPSSSGHHKPSPPREGRVERS